MEIDLGALAPRDAHDTLIGALIPRPIAWVSSIGSQGQVNLAPFSFFCGVTWSPPTLGFSVVNRSDGSRKDTIVNIEETGQFVVNMVSHDLAGRMVKTAASLPRGVSEADEAGVALAPSRKVSAPRVKDARVAFECALDRVVTVGQGAHAGNLVLGKILLVHVRDGIVEEGKGIDPLRFDAIGRLGGARFCRMQDIFEL